MSVFGSLGVISAGAVWRTTGLKSAGQALVRATASDDEQTSTLGGMMLVQAGERSVDLVREASGKGELNPILVKILADIGGPDSEVLLTEISQADDPHAREASESLETLERIKRLQKEEGGDA